MICKVEEIEGVSTSPKMKAALQARKRVTLTQNYMSWSAGSTLAVTDRRYAQLIQQGVAKAAK